MPVNSPPVTDIVALCVVVAATLFSNEAAEIIGPYVVIIVASTIGASFSLARRDKDARTGAIWFFARLVGLAILLTVGLAAWASKRWPATNERILLAPIALVIGFIGPDWPRLLRRFVKFVFAAIDLLRDRGGIQ